MPSEADAESGAGVAGIERICIGMPSGAKKVVDSRTMHSICVQDNVAAALLLDGLALRESPFPKVLEHREFAGFLAAGSTSRATPISTATSRPGRGAVVTVFTGAGAFTSRVDAPRGHSTRGGVTWPDLEEKWTEGLPGADVGRMIEIARRLEDIEDVSTLLDAVVG